MVLSGSPGRSTVIGISPVINDNVDNDDDDNDDDDDDDDNSSAVQ